MKLLSKLFNKKPTGIILDITSTNIMWNNSFHTLPGQRTTSNPFTVKIPFTNSNKVNELVKNIFKSGEGELIRVNEIVVYKPFELISTTPLVPIDVKPNQRIEFEVTIRGPLQNYSGPLSIKIVPENKELVKIELNKTRLIYKGKISDVDKSELILTLGKGQIFKNTVQMYKGMSYGDSVSNISINKPFELVSTEPNIPFAINDKNSYLVTFYIKAPDTNYAGPLEITLS